MDVKVIYRIYISKENDGVLYMRTLVQTYKPGSNDLPIEIGEGSGINPKKWIF